MAASPALPGLFLCFAAMTLLIFVSVSSPTWEKISFLDVGSGSSITHFGVFGFTGSKTGIGYDFNPSGLNIDDNRLNTSIIHNLTKVLILHPIGRVSHIICTIAFELISPTAAALSGLAVLFGICGASYHRVGTILMTLLSGLATIITLVIFIIDMVLFGIARNRFRDQGVPAQYGNANWLTLGALVALLLGFCASACGVFGRYRRRRETF
ncbi:actin cortical patch SUR7/pH-response regulator pali [Infundibulicybe gibba]|nr:actin cortical patch SUR7/pH-response regulator pali [Infundibulicybe gibba]